MRQQYPGAGCTCAAHSENECCCDADWTDPEVYELRDRLIYAEAAIRLLGEQIILWTPASKTAKAQAELKKHLAIVSGEIKVELGT